MKTNCFKPRGSWTSLAASSSPTLSGSPTNGSPSPAAEVFVKQRSAVNASCSASMSHVTPNAIRTEWQTRPFESPIPTRADTSYTFQNLRLNMLTMVDVGDSLSVLLVVMIKMIQLSAAYKLSFMSSNLFSCLVQLTAVFLDKYQLHVSCCVWVIMESILVILLNFQNIGSK